MPGPNSDPGGHNLPPRPAEEYLQDALAAFSAIPASEDFQSLCRERQIDAQAGTANNPHYWNAVAEFADTRAAEQEAAGADHAQVALEKLVAATPDYVLRQAVLNEKEKSDLPPSPESDDAIAIAIWYNSQVRHVAAQFPDMTASGLTQALIDVATASVGPLPGIEADIDSVIRGAQRELVFGQLLALTGRTFRHSTIEEDRKGFDYVVDDPNVGAIYVDVRTSVFRIIRGRQQDRKGYGQREERTYKIDYKRGIVEMSPVIAEEELNDRFTVPESVASAQGKRLADRLDFISKKLHAKRRRR